MKREEAIAILEVSKHMATSGRMYNHAIDMAIEALKILGDDGIVNCCGCIHWKTEYLLEALGVSTFEELMESADAVHIHNDGTLEVKVPNAQKVGRVLVVDTDSHIGGGLFYQDECDHCVYKWGTKGGDTK